MWRWRWERERENGPLVFLPLHVFLWVKWSQLFMEENAFPCSQTWPNDSWNVDAAVTEYTCKHSQKSETKHLGKFVKPRPRWRGLREDNINPASCFFWHIYIWMNCILVSYLNSRFPLVCPRLVRQGSWTWAVGVAVDNSSMTILPQRSRSMSHSLLNPLRALVRSARFLHEAQQLWIHWLGTCIV